MATATTRTLHLKMADGSEKIVSNVPATAKVTFGKVQPGEKPGGYDRTYCLRIYTTLNNQLAVFLNVSEFRDSSLAVQRKVAQTKAKRKHVDLGDLIEDTAEEVTEYTFVDE